MTGIIFTLVCAGFYVVAALFVYEVWKKDFTKEGTKWCRAARFAGLLLAAMAPLTFVVALIVLFFSTKIEKWLWEDID